MSWNQHGKNRIINVWLSMLKLWGLYHPNSGGEVCFGVGMNVTGCYMSGSERLTDGCLYLLSWQTGCLRPILNARTSFSSSEMWRTWRGCGPAENSGRTACGQSRTLHPSTSLHQHLEQHWKNSKLNSIHTKGEDNIFHINSDLLVLYKYIYVPVHNHRYLIFDSPFVASRPSIDLQFTPL